MTKSNAKSRNGQTKTLSPASVSPPTKGKGDKKAKGDGQKEKTSSNNLNGKIKQRPSITVKAALGSEVNTSFHINGYPGSSSCVALALLYNLNWGTCFELLFIMYFIQSQGISRKSQKSNERNGVATLSPELMQLKNMREADRQEKEGIVLWKRPFTTLHYFVSELCLTVQEYALK